jgi:hypothetical protein
MNLLSQSWDFRRWLIEQREPTVHAARFSPRRTGPKPLPRTAILCPIIFWRIVSLTQALCAATTDFSPALHCEYQPVFLELSSELRAPHGRKGVLPGVLAMRTTSLSNGGCTPPHHPAVRCPSAPSASQRSSQLTSGSCLSTLPKNQSAPISRSAFPISLFYLPNYFRPSGLPAFLPWCFPASVLCGRPAS